MSPPPTSDITPDMNPISPPPTDTAGERKMRHTVVRIKPVDYAQQSKRLLDLISRY
jgi:hypothetical protein